MNSSLLDAMRADWSTTRQYVSLLLAAMVLDLMGGVVASFKTKTLSSTLMREGIARKMVVLLIVGLAAMLDSLVSDVVVFGISLNLASIVALFYFCGEGLSLLEKAGKIGLPMPKPLLDALTKVQEAVDAVPTPAPTAVATVRIDPTKAEATVAVTPAPSAQEVH